MCGAHEKHRRLIESLRAMGGVVVAFSGGVDSTFLLKAAHDALGVRALAATAVSPSLSRREREEAARLAEWIGARHVWVETREMEDPRYRRNAPDRCYFCKAELFARLEQLAQREGLPFVAYGEIVDDWGDVRPGARAAAERGVQAPLAEVGLTKLEIRQLSRQMQLPTWDKPAMPCLASRVPHGEEVTMERLRQIEEAEAALAALQFRRVRVRHHGEVARVEVDAGDLMRAFERRGEVVAAVRRAGFRYVALDLEGYRPAGIAGATASP